MHYRSQGGRVAANIDTLSGVILVNREHSLRMLGLAVATALALAAGAATAAERIDLHRQDIQQLKAQYKASSAATMAHERHA